MTRAKASTRLAAGAIAGFFYFAFSASPALSLDCVGDCDGDGSVAVSELTTGVNIALGSSASMSARPSTRAATGRSPSTSSSRR